MSYVTPQTVYQIENRFVSFLNQNLIDPYQQVSGKVRNDFVKGSDFQLVGIFPKIQVLMINFTPEKITAQQVGYLDSNTIDFIIYYYNQNAHRFTFPDTGLNLTNEPQNFEYLQYIHNTIKDNITSFKEYIHKIKFGTISKPRFSKQNNTWVGMLPISCMTVRR